MRRIRILTGLVVLITFALLLWLTDSTIIDVYEKRLQTPLFTGFLTLGGFLLSLKTAILMKLKDEVYSSPSYKKHMNDQTPLTKPGEKLSQFGPLKRLGSFLILSVLCSICTSVSQLTLGFIHQRWAPILCISFAAGTVTLIFFAWVEIRANLEYWFQLLEEPK